MDDQRIGRALRRIRIEKGWRQADVAAKAGVSRALVSKLELGGCGAVDLDAVRRVGAALGAHVALAIDYRGATLDRLLSARHTQMSDLVVERLVREGWEVRPEVSFSHFGERGVVDLLAWQPARRALLIVELKTELADIGLLLAADDRRRRLAGTIAAPFGWRPAHVSSWLVIAEGATNRRRAAAHRETLRLAFPKDGHAIAAWLRDPSASIATMSFLSSDHPGVVRRRVAPTHRVRRAAERGPAGAGAVICRLSKADGGSTSPNDTEASK